LVATHYGNPDQLISETHVQRGLEKLPQVASTALRFAANLTAMGEQLGEEG